GFGAFRLGLALRVFLQPALLLGFLRVGLALRVRFVGIGLALRLGGALALVCGAAFVVGLAARLVGAVDLGIGLHARRVDRGGLAGTRGGRVFAARQAPGRDEIAAGAEHGAGHHRQRRDHAGAPRAAAPLRRRQDRGIGRRIVLWRRLSGE